MVTPFGALTLDTNHPMMDTITPPTQQEQAAAKAAVLHLGTKQQATEEDIAQVLCALGLEHQCEHYSQPASCG